MSEHKIILRWERQSPGFGYEDYNCKHELRFKNGSRVDASASLDYKGDIDCVDPEETFVAALSSCHMLSFLAYASKAKLLLDSYEDHAVGYLEKNAEGRFAITRVVLNPVTKFSGSLPAMDDLRALHDKAHHACFIANSVKTEVTVEPVLTQ